MKGPVIGGEKLTRQLARLAKESERTSQSALKKLAFEVRDEMQREVTKDFRFSGPSTEKFVSESFSVRYRTLGSVFEAAIYPLAKAGRILAKHVQTTTVRAADGDNLKIGDKIAIPVAVQRGKSGRVTTAQAPGALLASGKGFVNRAGTAVFRRRKKAEPELAYVLVSQATDQPRLDILKTAERAVRQRAGHAFADAIRRAIQRAKG